MELRAKLLWQGDYVVAIGDLGFELKRLVTRKGVVGRFERWAKKEGYTLTNVKDGKIQL